MKIKYFIILFLMSSFVFAVDEVELEKEKVLEFKKLKDVLKQDMLEDEVNKKNVVKKKYLTKKKKNRRYLYKYPSKEDLIFFSSEYWLVKQASKLEWDFTKPDYGITDSFKNLLEDLGFINQKFRILLLNDSTITHGYLPRKRDEVVLLLSVPFIRTLDLTKQEISVLLLEDFYRFKSEIIQKELLKKANIASMPQDFYDSKKPDMKYLERIHTVLDSYLLEKGYSFQEMFEITKNVSERLKNKPKLWNAYLQLIKKIDGLVKENTLYKNYTKLYPSPEMQIKWLTPKKEIL